MQETDLYWMSLLVFLPALFAVALLFFPRGSDNLMRWWSLFGTAITLGVSLCVFVLWYYDVIQTNLTNVERDAMSLNYRAEALDRTLLGTPARAQDWVSRVPWIPSFGIDYFLGLDGISMALVLLTTLITFLSMIASWKIDRHVRGYCILFLLLETGMLGTFVALDFVLFFVFWEVMLLPMYFLIGLWGGPRREYAAIKFFLYTMLGSVFILIPLVAFYFTDVRDFVSPARLEVAAEDYQRANPGVSLQAAREQAAVHTFDLMVLHKVGKAALQYLGSGGDAGAVDQVREARQAVEAARKAGRADEAGAAQARAAAVEQRITGQWFFQPWFQYTMFLLLFIGFAIKLPMFPFHTWLPDAHVEAPTPISMILAGVLLKMGGYGILRIAYPICPWAAMGLAWWLALFGIINIVYGAFAAMAQTDFKKLVAYSSISHMGYVILGVAVWASGQGAIAWKYGMNGAMFQMLAHGISSAGMFFLVGVIYERAHHRNLDNFRGLYEPMPLYTGLSAVIFFAAMGLPGLCGFIGEIYVVLATWQFDRTFAVLAALTVVLTAAYILWTMQRVYFGTNPAYKDYKDLDPALEVVPAAVLAVLAVALGVLPYHLVFVWMEPSVSRLVDQLAQVAR